MNSYESNSEVVTNNKQVSVIVRIALCWARKIAIFQLSDCYTNLKPLPVIIASAVYEMQSSQDEEKKKAPTDSCLVWRVWSLIQNRFSVSLKAWQVENFYWHKESSLNWVLLNGLLSSFLSFEVLQDFKSKIFGCVYFYTFSSFR